MTQEKLVALLEWNIVMFSYPKWSIVVFLLLLSGEVPTLNRMGFHHDHMENERRIV
jgi:hypothetical protein